MDKLKKRIGNLTDYICRPDKELLLDKNNSIYDLSSYLMSKQYFRKIHDKSVKILTIMACHSDTEEKYLAAVNNFNYLKFENNDIIVINSISQSYSEPLKDDLKQKCKSFIEIENNEKLDIGKLVHACKTIDVTAYDFIVFTNDSFFITGSIYPFYNLMVERNVDLYGFTTSSEIKFHYQSFLFGIKSSSIANFLDFYESKKDTLNNYEDVINHFEILFADSFENKDCYLNVGTFRTNTGCNIFFHNDLLYSKLIKLRLLPVIKIRRFGEEAKKENHF